MFMCQVWGGGVGECDGGCSSLLISLCSPTGYEWGLCLVMLLLLALRWRFCPAGLTRSLRVSEDSSMYARFSPKKSRREGWGAPQLSTTRTGTSFRLSSDLRVPSAPDSRSSELREFDSFSYSDHDQDSDGVSDPETDLVTDSEGDLEMALEPGLDVGFSSNLETDLDAGLTISLDPGLNSYAPSNLHHDLDRDSASDLISDPGEYLHAGHPRSRCPFSRITSASRAIPWANPAALGLGWRWWRWRFRLRRRWRWKGSLRSSGTGIRKSMDMFWMFWVQSVAWALSSSI